MKPSLCVFATLVFPLAANAQTVPDQNQVVPGERIGRVFLGDSRAAVRRRLGKPTATFPLNRGLVSELWKGKTPGAYGIRHTLEVVYRNGVAVQIEATNPIFKTKSGLSIDDFTDDWQKRLGEPTVSNLYYARKGDKQQGYYDWKRAGITIETLIDENTGEVTEENLTLIVHRAGVAVIPDPGGVAAG